MRVLRYTVGGVVHSRWVIIVGEELSIHFLAFAM